jgi:formyltetrahydrofolate hydrolase
VTEDLDEGPIIEQEVNRVSHLDGIDELTRKGFDVEKITLAQAIWRHLERKRWCMRIELSFLIETAGTPDPWKGSR